MNFTRALFCSLPLVTFMQAGDAEVPATCCLWAPEPGHLWNRLHETLFVRLSPDGQRFGVDRIDPLFWGSTHHLLAAESHRDALRILDEFIRKRGEKLVRDPLKRAFLQHDLWTLFDWAAASRYGEGYALERRELQERLVRVMRRVALSEREIASLPDNYARASNDPSLASLPRGLVFSGKEWVNVSLGVNGEAVAPEHRQGLGGRSVFQVWLLLPGGRASTIAYLEKLRAFEHPWILSPVTSAGQFPLVMNADVPQFPVGTQWALVRRMCLIDSQGRVRPSPVVQSIQVRRYDDVLARMASPSQAAQVFFEFVATRKGGDLREVLAGERDFFQFRAHDVDPFEPRNAQQGGMTSFDNGHPDRLRHCRTCHSQAGIFSVASYVRLAGHFQYLRPPEFVASDEDREWPATRRWKQQQYDFGLLQGLWAAGDP